MWGTLAESMTKFASTIHRPHPRPVLPKTIRRTVAAFVTALTVACGFAAGQQAQPATGVARQSLDDAWWTGPLLAPNASTLPRGHLLLEPYLFDVTTQGSYDRNGSRHSAPHSNGLGSLTYINYGLLDRLSVGLIPTASYNLVSHGRNSAGVGFGDLTAQAQYRLTQFHEGHLMPTISFNVQETFPTGKYDQLGSRPSDGVGSGAYTTTLSLYSQTFFWLPNGRILRTRFNVANGLSSRASMRDVSVYGTGSGFRGHARPGNTLLVDAAWEYSMTRSWVLALDAIYHHAANTHVAGYEILNPRAGSILLDSGPSAYFGFAPAVEYNLSGRIGVIVGTRIIGPGRNTAATITPAVAVNYVH